MARQGILQKPLTVQSWIGSFCGKETQPPLKLLSRMDQAWNYELTLPNLTLKP